LPETAASSALESASFRKPAISTALRATLRGAEEEIVQALQGKVAIITGASRGIGKAIALAFAERGAEVVLASKTVAPNPKLPGTLEDVAAEIRKKGGKAFIQPTDVRDEGQIQELVATTARELGGVDILINNAGALFWADVESTPAKRFDLVMSVNARAAFLCASAAIPHMKKRGGGAIVNMSPPYTDHCTKGRVAYMISKFGMSLLTEGLAAEVAKDGITVHSLWPVTMVESQATVGHHLGEPSMWRTPQILVDATVALVTKTSKLPSGSSLYDEDVLQSIGVTNFSKYACVAGTDPPRMRLDDPKGYWRQAPG
jgi:citronellol/citronellal dehydrogenase